MAGWEDLQGLGKPPGKKKEAIACAWKVFQVRANSCVELDSERDRNFLLVEKGTGRKLVLKWSNLTEEEAVLDMQNACLTHLAEAGFPEGSIPAAIPGRDGKLVGRFYVAQPKGPSVAVLARLLTYLPGGLLADALPAGPEVLESLGVLAGRMDSAMATFFHPAATRRTPWDLALAKETIGKFKSEVQGAERQRLVEAMVAWHGREVVPHLGTLRRAVVHGDFNDHNVIMEGGRVSGVIDFGDMAESHVVNNVAIATAYCALGVGAGAPPPDLVAVAASVLRGYTKEHPLLAEEVASVLPLVAMRLCTSVCMSAHNKAKDPSNQYLAVSEAPAWAALEALGAADLPAAQARLRAALGAAGAGAARAEEGRGAADAPATQGGRFQQARASNQLRVDVAGVKTTPEGPPSPRVEEVPSQRQVEARLERLMSNKLTLPPGVGAAGEEEARELPPSPTVQATLSPAELDAKFAKMLGEGPSLPPPLAVSSNGGGAERPPSPTILAAPTPAEVERKFDRLLGGPRGPRLDLGAGSEAEQPPSPTLEAAPTPAQLDARFGRLMSAPRMTVAVAEERVSGGGGAEGPVEEVLSPQEIDRAFGRLLSRPKVAVEIVGCSTDRPPSPTMEFAPTPAQVEAQFARLLSKPRVTLAVPAGGEDAEGAEGPGSPPGSPPPEEVLNSHQLDAKFERLLSGRRTIDVAARRGEGGGAGEEQPPSPTVLEAAPTPAQLDRAFERLMSSDAPRLEVKLAGGGRGSEVEEGGGGRGWAGEVEGGAGGLSPRLEVPPSRAELEARFDRLLGGPRGPRLDLGAGSEAEQPPSPTLEAAPTPAQLDARFGRLMSAPRMTVAVAEERVSGGGGAEGPVEEVLSPQEIDRAFGRLLSRPKVAVAVPSGDGAGEEGGGEERVAEEVLSPQDIDRAFDALLGGGEEGGVAEEGEAAPPVVIKVPKDGGIKDPITGLSGDHILATRARHTPNNLSLSYDEPLHMVRGEAQYLYSVSGEKYLDCVNNVAHVGHCHPAVVAATYEALARLNTNTRYLCSGLAEYTEALLATLPRELEVVFMCCTGSEANDLAMRLARAATGGAGHVACLGGGYHGHTAAGIDVSHYKFAGAGGGGRQPHVHVLPCPDVYRGSNLDGVASATSAVAAAGAGGGRLACFIGEAIPGCAGQVVLPPGYLSSVYSVARAAGAVCIADEVQTGFGRVGSHMWAFETQGVVPDIVTMGKPSGNGYPVGIVAVTRAVAEAFDSGMEYFNTFGGSNAACAAGLAVLRVLREEGLLARAADTGAMLKRELWGLAESCPLIGDVRGLGLFLGVELVLDAGSKRPAPAHAHWLVQRMQARGVLLSTDGPFHNVLKFKPPMCFSEGDAARLVQDMREVLLGELDEATSERLRQQDLAEDLVAPGTWDVPATPAKAKRPPMTQVRSRAGPAVAQVFKGLVDWRSRLMGGLRKVQNVPRVLAATTAVILAHGARG